MLPLHTLTQNGCPKCIKNWSSSCDTEVFQCSKPVHANDVRDYYVGLL